MHNCRNIKIREGKESRSNEIHGKGVRKKMKCVHSLEIPFFNSRAGNSPLEGKDRSYYRGMARVRRIVDEARTKEIRNRWNFSLDRWVQLKNKCRKSRARLSRKNEFSILVLFSSFSPTFCAFIWFVSPCVFLILFPSSKRRECRLKMKLIFDRFKRL